MMLKSFKKVQDEIDRIDIAAIYEASATVQYLRNEAQKAEEEAVKLVARFDDQARNDINALYERINMLEAKRNAAKEVVKAVAITR